jgi:hypothetical protein
LVTNFQMEDIKLFANWDGMCSIFNFNPMKSLIDSLQGSFFHCLVGKGQQVSGAICMPRDPSQIALTSEG